MLAKPEAPLFSCNVIGNAVTSEGLVSAIDLLRICAELMKGRSKVWTLSGDPP